MSKMKYFLQMVKTNVHINNNNNNTADIEMKNKNHSILKSKFKNVHYGKY